LSQRAAAESHRHPSGSQWGAEVEAVHVRYGAVHALNGVSVSFEPGTAHGLVGHNGSGKSTLARLLAGIQVPSKGAVRWDGENVAIGKGIPAVHQSLGLGADLTALENYGSSSGYDCRRAGMISWTSEAKRFEEHRSRLGVEVSPSARISTLPPSEQAAVAMMRVLRILDDMPERSRLVILDEITSYFDGKEREYVARLVKTMTQSGIGVIFVSHYLQEVVSLCSKVTVLRDGGLVGTYDCAGLQPELLSRYMFGDVSQIAMQREKESPGDKAIHGEQRPPARTVHMVGEISLSPHIDATISQGEILGVTGRSGGPQDFLPYRLIAAGRHSNFARRSDVRVALVPSDRLRRGIWLDGSIAENLTLSSLVNFCRSFPRIIRRSYERQFALDWLVERRFRVSGPSAYMRELSGGMQQKVLLGRALLIQPSLLVLHEPTQGIDVNARIEIFDAIIETARQGTAVLLVSSEYDELTALCDRVIVVDENGGGVVVEGSEITESALAALV
jgi:ribose transport system ATP-binding protein